MNRSEWSASALRRCGTFTVREGLEQLLAGTRLQVVRDAQSGALAVGLRPPSSSPPRSAEPAGLELRLASALHDISFVTAPAASPAMISLSPFEVIARTTAAVIFPPKRFRWPGARRPLLFDRGGLGIPRELIEDVGTQRVLDAAKYVFGCH